MRALLLVLPAAAAGGIDAVSYTSLGEVFPANMTGNTVLLGLALGGLKWDAIWFTSAALLGFVIGVATGAWIVGQKKPDVVWSPRIAAALFLEIVINAMTSVFAPFKEMTADEFHRVTEVTYLGTVYGTMAALRRMLPRDHGTIVQVGSALAYRSIPLQSAYCGAKHGIHGFTDSVRTELIHDQSNVRLTMVQMPALNTPQFGWVKSCLPNKAQPVPPIFQPEVAAEAIYWATHHYRREVYVGRSSVQAIIGNKIAPGLLDYYLARTGYASQQTSEPEDPDRPDNLWEPVPGDHGAHGTFDSRAQHWSPQLWATTHRGYLAAVGTSLVALMVSCECTNRCVWCAPHVP